jgi:hypothetical protein
MAESKQSRSTEGPPTEQLNVLLTEPTGGLSEVYSNFIELTWTPYDVHIRFSHAIPPNLEIQPESKTIIAHRAAVSVAWAEAKTLRDLLIQVIERFEKVNGEIVQPRLPI